MLDLKILSHVRVGEIWVNANEVGQHVARFAESLFFYTNYAGWEVSRRGSCALIAYRGRFFVVSTYHQIKDWNPEYLGIRLGREYSYVTGGALYWDKRIELNEWDDAFDLVALDYTETVQRDLIDSRMFYPGFGAEFLRNGEKIVAALVVGFAGGDQEDEVSEGNDCESQLVHMRLVKRILIGRYLGDSYQNEIFAVEGTGNAVSDYNGLSGSPVFVICGDAGDYCVKIAGIVLRAGAGKFHCLKHDSIRKLLDQFYASQQ